METQSGDNGRKYCRRILAEKGLKIIERNFRCRLGEVDIIARQGKYLVFVEVRTRSSSSCGPPEESITAAKINKLRRLARVYMQKRSLYNVDVRFDVVAVKYTGKTTIDHIENAF